MAHALAFDGANFKRTTLESQLHPEEPDVDPPGTDPTAPTAENVHIKRLGNGEVVYGQRAVENSILAHQYRLP